jgi:hypothetical protein
MKAVPGSQFSFFSFQQVEFSVADGGAEGKAAECTNGQAGESD